MNDANVFTTYTAPWENIEKWENSLLNKYDKCARHTG